MARRSKRRSSPRRISIVRTAAIAVPLAAAAVEANKEAKLMDKVERFTSEIMGAYTGIEVMGGVTFDASRMAKGLGPLAAAKVVAYAKRSLGNPTLGPLPITL